METKEFIQNYIEAFGSKAPLPLLFGYSDEPIAETEKIGGCFFKGLQAARDGQPVSLSVDVIGDGVDKNLEECAFWYELAANGGDAQAQFATGWFLMTGTGVPQDERKGLKWIHKATFQGYQPAIDYCKEHGYKWY